MSQYDPTKHHRRSIRYLGYDYTSPDANFVTICVQNHECLLGDVYDIVGITEPPSDADESETGRGEVSTPVSARASAIEGEETSPLQLPPGSLGQIVAYFKYQSTKRINALRGAPGVRF